MGARSLSLNSHSTGMFSFSKTGSLNCCGRMRGRVADAPMRANGVIFDSSCLHGLQEEEEERAQVNNWIRERGISSVE